MILSNIMSCIQSNQWPHSILERQWPTGCTSTNDNHLLSEMFASSFVLRRVYDFPLKFILNEYKSGVLKSETWCNGGRMVSYHLRECWNIRYTASPSMSKDNMTGFNCIRCAIAAFDFYGPCLRLPRNWFVLLQWDYGRIGPDVEFQCLCIGFEPVGQLYEQCEKRYINIVRHLVTWRCTKTYFGSRYPYRPRWRKPFEGKISVTVPYRAKFGLTACMGSGLPLS